MGMDDTSGGRSPASIRATGQEGASERRDAITAPAEPPPTTTTKSKVPDILPPRLLFQTDVPRMNTRNGRNGSIPPVCGEAVRGSRCFQQFAPAGAPQAAV